MAPTYMKVTPSLPVTSVPKAIGYYCEVLGFRIAGRDRDDHTWLQLASSEDEDKYSAAVNVYLRRRTFPDIDNDVQFGKIHIRISGADDELERLAENMKNKGVVMVEDITVRPWGLKHFTVKDHDGNILNFDQAVAGWTRPSKTVME